MIRGQNQGIGQPLLFASIEGNKHVRKFNGGPLQCACLGQPSSVKVADPNQKRGGTRELPEGIAQNGSEKTSPVNGYCIRNEVSTQFHGLRWTAMLNTTKMVRVA